MKKILFATAIIGLLFAGCDKDPNNGNDPETEAVRKLPSKMRWDYVGYEGVEDGYFTNIHFEYDDQNRLVALYVATGDGDGSYSPNRSIVYDVNGNPTEMEYDGMISIFRYSGNQVFVSLTGEYYESREDTLTINADGQLVKTSWRDERYWGERNYTYNSNGNLIEIDGSRSYYPCYSDGETTWCDSIPHTYTQEMYYATYSSEVRSIWRHVNTPDWFWVYIFDGGEPSKGYMKSSHENVGVEGSGSLRTSFQYELDADGYVRQMNIRNERANNIGAWVWTGSTLVVTFEYIPAK